MKKKDKSLEKVVAHNNIFGEIHKGDPYKCKEKTCVKYFKQIAEDYHKDRGWQS